MRKFVSLRPITIELVAKLTGVLGKLCNAKAPGLRKPKKPAQILSSLLVAIMAGTASTALAEAPVTTRFEGTLVAPSAAFSYFGSGTGHTDGLASSSEPPSEIKALARSLSRDGALTGDAFAARVAEYVRKNIETEFRFGLGKGARGALIDQSGTVFDQAELMVEILREGGHPDVSYELGTITLDATAFGRWTGLVSGLNETNQTFAVKAKAACELLANGGIPATFPGASSCSSLSGNLTTVTIAHLWVKAGNMAYDPGFKVNVLRSGIDVAAAMGCGTEASSNCGSGLEFAALNGATTNTISGGAVWIKDVNEAGVRSFIGSRATSLQSNIEAIDPTASIEDIFGGMAIDPKQAVQGSTSLPYPSSFHTSWTEIPDQYRTTFRLRFLGALDTTFFADEISGKRIRLRSFASFQPNPWIREIKLYLNANVVASVNSGPTVTSGQPDRVRIDVDHPFANDQADDTAYVTIQIDTRDSEGRTPYEISGGSGYVGKDYWWVAPLVLDVGNAGSFRETHFSRLMNAREIDVVIVPSLSYLSGFNQKQAETLVARYAGQARQAFDLLEGVSSVQVGNLHTVGAMFNGGDEQLYFNVRHGLTLNSPNSSQTFEDAAFLAAEAAASALEGSVLQQSQDGFESSSSVSMFKLANDKNFRFYSANASNIANVNNAISDYNSARKQTFEQYANSGLSLIIPEYGSIGVVDLPGSGTGEIAINTIPEYAYGVNKAGHLINEEFKGGGAAAVVDPVKGTLDSAKADSPSMKDKSYWGVDLASGSLTLTPPADIGVGSGIARLEFSRTMAASTSAEMSCDLIPDIGGASTQQEHICFPVGAQSASVIGGGWRTNINENATWSGSGGEGLGATSALRSSFSAAALFTIFDAYKVDTFQRKLASIFGTHALIDGFVRNSISDSNGREFIRLPDGSYDPPPSSRSAKAAISGAPSDPFVLTGQAVVRRSYQGTQITITEGDGSVAVYQPSQGFGYPYSSIFAVGPFDANNMSTYSLVSRTYPTDFRKSYGYEIIRNEYNGLSKKIVDELSNSAGYQLNIVHLDDSNVPPTREDFKYVLGVIDQAQRSVAFSCGSGSTVYLCELTATDLLNGESRYVLASGTGAHANSVYPDRILKSWYTPSSATIPFMEFGYDPVLHLASHTNNENETTKFFTSNIASDRFRFGEIEDPLGNVTSTIFDERASAVKVIDPLGRSTTNTYDSAGRLLRTVLPEGNATEYTYDVRGNALTECQIAKGRVNWSNISSVTEKTPQCDVNQGDLLTTTDYLVGPEIPADNCPNAKTCNKPDHVIDPRGYRTNYSWSTVHGQLLSTKFGLQGNGTTCDIGSTCPETTYGYTSFPGSDGATFYLLTSMVEKIDSTRTRTTNYGYDATNHYTLKSATVTATGETESLKTSFQFDGIGNLVSVTEPLNPNGSGGGGGVNGGGSGGSGGGTGAILSIGDDSVIEGEALSFTVTTSAASPQQVTATYTISNVSTSGSDYSGSRTGTVTFPVGSNSPQTITIQTTDDSLVENEEQLNVTLSVPTGNATIDPSNGAGIGTIQDNDIGISIGDAEVLEGGMLQFPITRSGSIYGQVSVDWSVTNGSASSSSDFTAANGNPFHIANQQTNAFLLFQTTQDTILEGNETFQVNLSNAQLLLGGSVAIGDGNATGTIIDDEGVSFIQITDSNFNVLPAHQSTYNCSITEVIVIGYLVYDTSCRIRSTGVTVYRLFWGYETLAPAYQKQNGLRVLSTFYGQTGN